MIKKSIEKESLQALEKMLRPVIRLMLRSGVSFGDYLTISRRLFVQITDKELEFSIDGREQTAARVSLITGINRRDVKRMLDAERMPDPEGVEFKGDKAYTNRAVRVLTGWSNDKQFLDKKGKPRVLIYSDSKSGGFEQLVKSHAGDLPPKSVLEELIRVGSVREVKGEQYELINSSYVPLQGTVDQIGLGADSIYDLTTTINVNVFPKDGEPSRNQRQVVCDNIPDESIKAYKAQFEKESEIFRKKQNDILSKLDRDHSNIPKKQGNGRNRLGFGIYYIEEKIE